MISSTAAELVARPRNRVTTSLTGQAIARLLRSTERAEEERAAATYFAVHLNRLGDLEAASPALQAHILAAVKFVALRVDLDRCTAGATYGHRLLHEDPAGWSLAAISLRPGQSTPSHDHGGWGGAVIVHGIERDRRFVDVGDGVLELISERDYLPGTSYTFGPTDIHQPVGADRSGLTVALHFLVHGRAAATQLHHEATSPIQVLTAAGSLLEDAA